MAEQSKPNTFGKGMMTDLDPGYQPKDSYFTGLNIRVITNGENSYSLENIQSPKRVYDLDAKKTDGEFALPGAFLSSTDRYLIHGAVVVDDYIITVECQNSSSTSKEWKIRKYLVDQNGIITNSSGIGVNGPGELWEGDDLFSHNAGEIELESIVETETIHRIYATDGIGELLSINVKDANLSSKTVSDFKAFKPNIMVQASLSGYNDVGGGLQYGSYSYTYRLASRGQSNYSDWAPISRPVNVVNGSLSSGDNLTIKGETSSETSNKSIKLSITGISTEYEIIEIAAIRYSSKNVSTIEIIETGSISSSTYELVHSGFETTTVVSGGIASVVISNKTWNTCKTLAQKDNKLFAGNLTSTPMNINIKSSPKASDELESLVSYKLKSYKITASSEGDADSNDYSTIVVSSDKFQTHSEEANPHRHQNGSGGQRIYDHTNVANDKNHYKFLGKNFGSTMNPKYCLGAETPGFSHDSNVYGFRLTFSQIGYKISDSANHTTYAGATGGDSDAEYEAIPYSIGVDQNNSNFGGGKPGPHNPAWDFKYRSFKRGECYRFGIVFYDLKGVPGFVHHLGDIKMPEAMDQNNSQLSPPGSGGSGLEDNRSRLSNNTTLDDDSYMIKGWQPFSQKKGNQNHYGWALIPKIEVRLPDSITSQISGYKIVRAELQDNDKTIITQGVLNHCVIHHSSQGLNSLRGKALPKPWPYSVVEYTDSSYSNANSNPYQIHDNAFTLDTPDVTIGGKSYNFSDGGYDIRNVCPIIMGNEYMDINSVAYGTSYNYGTLVWGGGIVLNDGLANASYSSGGGSVNMYKTAVGFRYRWMTKEDLGVSTDDENAFDVTQLNVSGGSTGLFMSYHNVDFGKTVVNGEQVTTSESGLSEVFENVIPENTNGNTGTGLTAYYGEASIIAGERHRADYKGNAVTTILLKCSSTSPAKIEYEGAYDHVGQALGYIDNSGGNAWNNDKRYNNINSKWISEIVRDTSSGFEQYGGYNDSAIENTRFYDCSIYQDKSVTLFEITGGDTFCDYYTYKNRWPSGNTGTPGFHNDANTTGLAYYYNTAVPLESSYNTSLRYGTYYGSSKILTQPGEDNYSYNTAYSQETNLVSSVVKPLYWDDNNIFKNKIAASRTKIPGEPFDAWTQFPANDFIEVNLQQGKITDLVNYKNQLYAIQDQGVAALSVNPRALISGEGAAADIQIVTGSGNAIERFDYITSKYGSQHFNKSLVTPTGIYFLDAQNSEIIKFNEQGVNPLSLSNQYKSYITSFTQNKTIPINENNNLGKLTHGIFCGYDNEFRECHFTIVDSAYSKYSFVISDLDGKLISKLGLRDKTRLNSNGDIKFKRYISYQNRLYGVGHSVITGTQTHINGNLLASPTTGNNNDAIFLFNSGVYQNFNVGFVVNDNAAINKIFDTSEVITDVENTTDKFTIHNLEDSTGNNSTGGGTLERIREGIHRLPLRGASDTHRMRGNWMKHTITYYQSLSSELINPDADKKFNIFAVNTRYRQSR
tara:strand:+ start:5693 stop:10186 length:4494 start_codon:yes stop_codon:yes gene_type:complete